MSRLGNSLMWEWTNEKRRMKRKRMMKEWMIVVGGVF